MLETIFEAAYVEISIEFLMEAMTVWQPTPPLAFVVLYVRVIFGVLGAEVEPVELPLAVLLAVEVLSDVNVAVGVYLDS